MSLKFQSEPSHESRLFPDKPVVQLFILGFLFITAFCIRLYHINKPPLDFAPTRQYQSANIARGYYFKTLESIPEWRRQVARINMNKVLLEPRIMEHVASFAYRIVGGEKLWIPRVLSSVFWMIGGIFLYLIAQKITSADAAIFSTIFYLFLPFGISASRSFQPDPMMLMMFLFSIFTILRYYENPSIANVLYAAIISSLAMLVKPLCVFTIFGAFISLSIYRQGIRKSIINLNVLFFTVVSLLPTVIYYGYGLLSNFGTFQEYAKGSFLPHLMLYPYFWKDWFAMIGHAVGYIAFIVAIFGFLMFRQGLPMALLIGLWFGYFFFGLSVTYHIHTHDYYQLQLIPIVALSLGPVGALVINRLTNKLWLVTVLSILLLVTVLGIGLIMHTAEMRDVFRDYKRQIRTLGAIFGVNPQFNEFLTHDFEKEVKIAQEIGKIVDHSTKTVFLTSDFGHSLSYYGELSGLYWPKRSALLAEKARGLHELTAEERFNAYYAKTLPEYFIVTDLNEFERQLGLRIFFTENFPVLVENDDYMIFSLRNKSVLDKNSKKN